MTSMSSCGGRAQSPIVLAVFGAIACVMPSSLLAQDMPVEGEEEQATLLEVALLRTWDSGGVTNVDGVAEIPLSILNAGTTGEYRFELAVYGDSGLQLYRDSWERALSSDAAAYSSVNTSTMLESFRFGVKEGVYEIELRAYSTDAPDLGTSTRRRLEGYEERPVASDLFVADRVESIADGASGRWSIAHGGFGISAVARTTIVLASGPELFYYLELYGQGDSESTYQVTASIHRTDGQRVFETPPQTVTVDPYGLPYAGRLPVEGLPPGDYQLQLEVRGTEGTAATRRADFRAIRSSMVAEGRQPDRSEELEYFESLSATELENTFGGVPYLLTESNRQAYSALPVDAQRRFLAEFFARRDPSPGRSGNEYLEQYMDRVGIARAKYGELIGTGEVLPWMTDPGRLILRKGEPDERVINHFPSGADNRPVGGVSSLQGEVPYEIWSYHSTGYVYLFTQENQLGGWQLIFTTDPDIRSLADWSERVGAEALRDLSTQFGVQPRF